MINVITKIIIFNKSIMRGQNYRSKIPCGLPTVTQMLSQVTVKTSWPAPTATSWVLT